MNAWFALIVAGFFEVAFTTCMKLSNGFRSPVYVVGFLVCAGASFYFLSHASHEISLGTAYAVWTGIGAAGTAVMGFVFFGDPFSMARLFFLSTLILSIVGLKFVD
jgi:quaternary ammonium compound-resistance protein SugE